MIELELLTAYLNDEQLLVKAIEHTFNLKVKDVLNDKRYVLIQPQNEVSTLRELALRNPTYKFAKFI